MTRMRIFIEAVRVMYHACRTDYPCEGCEMGRWASFKSAWSWGKTV